MNYAELQNPLFLHPLEVSSSLNIEEKLVGASNYRTWCRSMEIDLATKRKPGFITGTVVRPEDDLLRADKCDTCNHVVISWILGVVSDSIRKSVLFIDSAKGTWIQLEKRFSLSNGSRIDQLNKEVYELEQNGTTVSEFYTKMSCIWEELDSINDLPKITTVTTKISNFLKVLMTQRGAEVASIPQWS